MFTDTKIIHRYTRADAITDGVLVDADSIEAGICASAGFRVPVASTRATWADTVEWNEDTIAGEVPSGAWRRVVLDCARFVSGGVFLHRLFSRASLDPISLDSLCVVLSLLFWLRFRC